MKKPEKWMKLTAEDLAPREHVMVVRLSESEKAILTKKVKDGNFGNLSNLVRWYLFCR